LLFAHLSFCAWSCPPALWRNSYVRYVYGRSKNFGCPADLEYRWSKRHFFLLSWFATMTESLAELQVQYQDFLQGEVRCESVRLWLWW
jgi:hypothetical protein